MVFWAKPNVAVPIKSNVGKKCVLFMDYTNLVSV
jgi:hypothetical protein